MNFVSFTFLFFLFVVLTLYFVMPYQLRWIMLLVASYVFYAWWNYQLLFLIIGTTLIAYIGALVIDKTAKLWLKRLSLIIVIVSSLSVLFVFKYLDFLIENIVRLCNHFGWKTSIHVLKLLLPVGISFYSFQTMSYVIDVYRGDIEPERHLGYFALFVSFFPQLVAGPIERPEHLIPQLKRPHPFSIENLATGTYIALIGFFKKVVVADMVAQHVNIIYNNPSMANGFEILIATLLFAVQIYCDFSGYTDIAIGVAKIMGIDLMKNFNKPYSATSIKDFWSRWHISLTTWFRDYLYIPLGGNRVGKFRHLANIAIVFLISGLWHGAEWTFIVWGCLHALYQIVGNVTAGVRKRVRTKLHIQETSMWYKSISQIITFALVCFAWIFFRANSISDSGMLISKLFTGWEFNISFYIDSLKYMSIDVVTMLFIILSILLLKKLGNIEIRNDYFAVDYLNGTNTKQRRSMRINSLIYTIFLVLIIAVTLASSGNASSFIYFQF